MQEGLTESDAVKEGLLINTHNGAMKQYYYNVIKELHDIGLGDMSEFTKGVLFLGLAVILFLLADVYDIKHFSEVFKMFE